MANKKSQSISSLKSLVTFTSHFLHYCHVLRGLLGAKLAIVLLGGVVFARFEGLPMAQGIYFSLITATTVGFGDISPQTGYGQCVSVFLAIVGTILFGLVVAVATQAFSVTIREYLHAEENSRKNS